MEAFIAIILSPIIFIINLLFALTEIFVAIIVMLGAIVFILICNPLTWIAILGFMILSLFFD